MAAAVESLSKLEEHYQAQYEEYMTLAMNAKANLERLRFLLTDLAPKPSLESTAQFSLFDLDEADNDDNEMFTASLEDEQEQLADFPDVPDEEPEANQEISHRRFIELLDVVMPVLESVFDTEQGKTLHINYLHKIVNQQTLLSLSLDTVVLYLEEAIDRGFCGRDKYDRECYLSLPDKKALLEEAFSNNPYKSIKANVKASTSDSKTNLNQKAVTTLERPTHSLPLNPRVKMTIPDTIQGYILERQPDTFIIKDVINYLYSQTEQKQWSAIQRKQIITSISNSLSKSKEKEWSRIQPGVYKPLLTPEQDNSVSTKTKASYNNLPFSSKSQANILDIIENFIAEFKPKTFTARDILDDLYTKEEQKTWTKEQDRKNIQAISGKLGDHVNKNWKRLRRGVYQPIG